MGSFGGWGKGVEATGGRDDVTGMGHTLKGFADVVVGEGDEGTELLSVQGFGEEAQEIEDMLPDLGTLVFAVL